jgi:hypothetical protein
MYPNHLKTTVIKVVVAKCIPVSVVAARNHKKEISNYMSHECISK